MRLFNDTVKSYKTEENAIKAVTRKNPELLDKYRWLVSVNSEGRYTVVFIGTDTLDIMHAGFCIAA